MRLLAIDTTCRICSVALAIGEEVRWRQSEEGHAPAAHALPMAGELLAEAGMAATALDAVAFGAGPGAFTGVRIACGLAQGIALAADLPVVPVGSLSALAAEAGEGWVLACLDARMGEVYHACLRVTAGGACETVVPAAVCAPAALPRPAHVPGGWIAAGDGFAVQGEALRERLAGVALRSVLPGCLPHARAVARLGRLAVAAGEGVAAERAAPLYVRDKVALDRHEQAALRARRAELRQ